MMRIAVFGSSRNETNRELAVAWRKLGIEAFLCTRWDTLARLRPGDIVLGRIDVRPSLDGAERGLLDLVAATELGMRVLNRAPAILRAHDKLRTTRALVRANVAHPRTAHIRGGEPFPLAPPFVLKPRFGSWGRDVVLCETREDAKRQLNRISSRPWFRRQGALVQELVPPTGYDLRVLVAAGTVVGAIERVAAPGEWRTNISLGGTRRRASPSPAAAALAVAAVAALDGDFFGVDLMPVDGGYTVLEVNGAAEFDPAYGFEGADVYGEIAGALGLAVAEEAVA